MAALKRTMLTLIVNSLSGLMWRSMVFCMPEEVQVFRAELAGAEIVQFGAHGVRESRLQQRRCHCRLQLIFECSFRRPVFCDFCDGLCIVLALVLCLPLRGESTRSPCDGLDRLHHRLGVCLELCGVEVVGGDVVVVV